MILHFRLCADRELREEPRVGAVRHQLGLVGILAVPALHDPRHGRHHHPRHVPLRADLAVRRAMWPAGNICDQLLPAVTKFKCSKREHAHSDIASQEEYEEEDTMLPKSSQTKSAEKSCYNGRWWPLCYEWAWQHALFDPPHVCTKNNVFLFCSFLDPLFRFYPSSSVCRVTRTDREF